MLMALATHYPGEPTFAALGEATDVDFVQASEILDRLAEAGFVELRRSPDDARSSRARLTEPGMAVAFGLAQPGEDARRVVEKLEAATLVEIERQRRRRSRRRQLAAASGSID
jgi:hypothetical protein